MRCPSRRYRNIPEHTGSVGSKKPTERTPLGGFEVGSSSVDPAEHTGGQENAGMFRPPIGCPPGSGGESIMTAQRPAIPGLKTELCPVCNELFSRTSAGDLHRVGDYYDHHDPQRPYIPRRCLTPDEIAAKGLVRNAKGVWHWPGSDDWRSTVADLPAAQPDPA